MKNKVNINNIFYRKKQIINILDNINFDLLTNLDEQIKQQIKDIYLKTRSEIYKHYE